MSLTSDNDAVAVKMNDVSVTYIDTAVCGQAKKQFALHDTAVSRFIDAGQNAVIDK